MPKNDTEFFCNLIAARDEDAMLSRDAAVSLSFRSSECKADEGAAQTSAAFRDCQKKCRVQRLPKVYKCEACRVIVEETENVLGALAKEWQKKQNEGMGPATPFDPGNLLNEICDFSKNGKKQYKEMWSNYPRTYRRFCSEFMREKSNQEAVMKALSGSRQDDQRSRQQNLVRRVKGLCQDQLKLCPADRFLIPILSAF